GAPAWRWLRAGATINPKIAASVDSSYLDDRIGLAAGFRHGGRNVVNGDALAGVTLIDPMVRMAVEDGAHLVEAVDGLGEAGRPKKRVDRLGFDTQGLRDRRIVQEDDGALGLQRMQRMFEAQGLVQRLLHEGLDRGLAEGAE